MRLASFQKCLIGCYHRATRCQHGVNDDNGLAFYAGRGHIFGMDTHLSMFTICVHTEGRHKAILGMVEYVQKAFVEGQSSTQHRSEQYLVLNQWNVDST